ncbi:UNVERIFIED_ORG: hypothetical protein J2Y81_002093 [Paraburkholderia sediminicola]|nr:hypothetical protein [Paraburkholderia sediminicola]
MTSTPRADAREAPVVIAGAMRTASGADCDSWRLELVGLVEGIARFEQWSAQQIDQVVYIVEHQPASALMPDLHHFRDRAAERISGPKFSNGAER